MSIGYGLSSLGFWIFLSVVVYVDYQEYLRCGRSLFFDDKTEIEKKIRIIQEIKISKEFKEVSE